MKKNKEQFGMKYHGLFLESTDQELIKKIYEEYKGIVKQKISAYYSFKKREEEEETRREEKIAKEYEKNREIDIERSKLKEEIETLKNKLKYKNLKKTLYKIRLTGWFLPDEDSSEDFDIRFSAIDYFDSTKQDIFSLGEELKTFNIVDLKYKNHSYNYFDGYHCIEKIWINDVLEYDNNNKDTTKIL
jgi:actin-related protein